jgi:uridine kinase
MRPLIIGIAGGTGSGKSTLAQRIAQALEGARVSFIDMDAYYKDHGHLPMEDRRRINWDHPDAFDTELLASHLEALARGEAIDKPVYDFTRHARATETVRVEPADVIVIDGILLLVDERVRDACDVKVFVETEDDIRLIRRIRRDMAVRGRPLEEILDQYLTTVQPMHLQFVEPSKRWADLIIPRGGENPVALDILIASIARRLQEPVG